MDYKLIHICNDEKFINSAMEQFEAACPNRNIFYIVDKIAKDKFKFVNKNEHTIAISENDLLTLEINEKDIVILHSLNPLFYDFINAINIKIEIICIFFGYEIYNDYYFNNFKDIYETETILKYKLSTPSKFDKLKQFIKLHTNFNDHKYSLKRKINALKRLNYFGIPYTEELQEVSIMTRLQKKQFKFWYYPLEKIIDINAPIQSNKTNILIGHSGTTTCNHLDVFLKIKPLISDTDKVVLPLNYGDQEYIQLIKKEAPYYFNQNVRYLDTFMPINEYNAILSSIKIAILNNKRQQAIGNTIALIWHGAKVYLSEKNTFYHFLKRNNILVFSYENELIENSLNCGLNNDIILKNRSSLQNIFKAGHLNSLLINEILNLNEQ